VLLLVAALLTSCGGLTYELDDLPFPVVATPAPEGATVTPFSVEQKKVLWIHGLLGHTQPDVAQILRDQNPGPGGIANFRVKVGAGFHDWLVAHLSLTLVRMKSVVVEGELVGPAR